MPMNEKQSFSLEIYKQTRAEMTGSLSRIESLLKYTLAIPALVFSWILTQGYGLDTQGQEVITCLKLPRELLSISWYIPPVVIVLGFANIIAVYIRISELDCSLKKCEATLGDQELNQDVSRELEEPERKNKSRFPQKYGALPESLQFQAYIHLILLVIYLFWIAGGAEYGYDFLSDRPYCRPDKTYSISQTDRSDTQQQTGSITLPASPPTNNPIQR